MSENIFNNFPKVRNELPEAYKKIYNQYYIDNRLGATKITYFSSKMEQWLHKKVAQTAGKNKSTLELGAGTLNQLDFEKSNGVYDIVEPYALIYQSSPHLDKIRNIYNDILDVPLENKYDRITAIACFEHICNLPEVVERVCHLLDNDGVLCVSIPNEGRFLWEFAYTYTTGLEFKKKYGLDYSVLMNYEHVNTADEIEEVLKYYFNTVKMSLFGIGKDFSFYRYYECSEVRSEKISLLKDTD